MATISWSAKLSITFKIPDGVTSSSSIPRAHPTPTSSSGLSVYPEIPLKSKVARYTSITSRLRNHIFWNRPTTNIPRSKYHQINTLCSETIVIIALIPIPAGSCPGKTSSAKPGSATGLHQIGWSSNTIHCLRTDEVPSPSIQLRNRRCPTM